METIAQNRVLKTLQHQNKLLSIYFTAGFPELDSTLDIIRWIEQAGGDMVEVGIPFSDPIADGLTIQESSMQALKNGMSVSLLFEQLENLRKQVEIPVLLMGYLNPILQYGIKKFCKDAEEVGIDGLIIPDLPLQEYLEDYRDLFNSHQLFNIFLVSPQTNEERVKLIDKNSGGFIYLVSSASVTGAKGKITKEQESYFKRIASMELENPCLIGFGISSHDTYMRACHHARGAIIGSAFIEMIKDSQNLEKDIAAFIKRIKTGKNT